MKDWIMELCPEIEEWQADLIAEHHERIVALLKRTKQDLEILKTAMRVGPPEYDWRDYQEMVDDIIAAMKEKLND